MNEGRAFWVDTIPGPGDGRRGCISNGGAEEKDHGPVYHRAGVVHDVIEVIGYSLKAY